MTPDDWQIAIFSGDNPTRWRSNKRADQRDRIEGKLVEVGMRAARLGINVVFDFGFWGEDERSALRWIADTLGARAQVVYLPITFDEQRRRITRRYETDTGQFEMSDAELRQWRPGPAGRPSAGHRCQISTNEQFSWAAWLAASPAAGRHRSSPPATRLP